jgi:hypothetical protein
MLFRWRDNHQFFTGSKLKPANHAMAELKIIRYNPVKKKAKK